MTDKQITWIKKFSLFTFYLGLWIVALFTVAIAFSYLTEYLQSSGFFDDTLLTSADKNSNMDQWHDWGIRHKWFQVMCILLFIISIGRIVGWAAYYWDKDEMNS